MDSENPEDFTPALILAEEDHQEIGGLINSDGEEVDFTELSEQIMFNKDHKPGEKRITKSQDRWRHLLSQSSMAVVKLIIVAQ